MIGFVLTGHGPFPEGVLQSVQLITGEVSQVKVVPFETDTIKLQNELETAIAEVDTGSGVVCFADLAGGTPFNVSSRIAVGKEAVQVIGGINTPMLLSGFFQREQDLDTFVNAVVQEGKDNIKPFEMNKKEKAADHSNGI
ncbi:PTS sugar transporter subunit IIA [Virgibacillus sp. NKC19-3]|uniref:PTS sugar transporter subunit IIA n=1 Tax=Virgibacillus saliphilus TaxID=2831674 RepID=UPI001C9A4573|nr:PTS sugar transporter subunit IIA [Virgibacillus sp. NKC19-3]MBY7142861.1 PTS sugar transporter subunit IIA [Virgibacillus sp. NKC19-3]